MPDAVARHADAQTLPTFLAALHRETPVGDVRRIQVATDDRHFVEDTVVGAGFALEERPADRSTVFRIRRERSLADTVAFGMRLLVCGLNPSEYAADAGVGFARPGNRFWPAAIAAALVTVDRDPVAALEVGLGMTDLVKRATPRADVLGADEYTAGVERVERLVKRFQPGAVCFVGLAGWRAAVDRAATRGEVTGGFGGRPTWLMPSTSGANASSSLDDLTDDLRTAAALADASL